MPDAPRRTVLYMALSLDGFIARRDGSVDWLPTGGEEDYGYAQFLSTIDTVLIGRVTYEQLLTFGPFPYNGKKCYVFSKSRTGRDEHVEFVDYNVRSFMSGLRSSPGKNIWLVGGAVLAQEFLRAGEVDEIVLTVVPRVLGDGIPLFERGGSGAEVSLRESRTYSDGLVQVHYDLLRR